MSEQNYSGGNNPAGPRQAPTRSRHRGSADSAAQEASAQHASVQQLQGRPMPLEPGGFAGLPAMQPPTQPPALGSMDQSSFSDEYSWAPQHARAQSAFAPSHQRQAASFYQPPAYHQRDQSASDFYFIQSPHGSPSLGTGGFDPLGLDPNFPGLSRAPIVPLGSPAGAQLQFPRHARGSSVSSSRGSVSKRSPLRSHRRTHTSTGSEQMPAPARGGFPGPLVQHDTSPVHGGFPGPLVQRSDSRHSHGPHVPAGVEPGVSGPQPPIAAHGVGQAPGEPLDPLPVPAEPTPLLPVGMGPAFTGLLGEGGTAPPVWSEQTGNPSLDPSMAGRRSKRSKRRRHSRRKTRDETQQAGQAPGPVLVASNPMSDFNYSPQGAQYHGLGIGLSGPSQPPPPPPSVISGQQFTPSSMSPPQMYPIYGGTPASQQFGGDVVQPSLQGQPPLNRPNMYFESTPTLSSMPFLPPYVSYEQQLQLQQQQQQQQQQQHQQQQQQDRHHDQRQQQPHARWREEDIWPSEYWDRYDRPPVPGPSNVQRPQAGRPMEPPPMPLGAAPARPAWPGTPPHLQFRPPPHGAQLPDDVALGSIAVGSQPAPGHAYAGQLGTMPERSPSQEGSVDPEEPIMDVPGPDYADSAKMTWVSEDTEELMRLLEPAEKHKWKYMSDLLTERRKKRIPLRTCQNKFHALFGETESSSRLHSSLFYVAYRSGWDSIKESTTMRERDNAVFEAHSSAQRDELEKGKGTSEEAAKAATKEGAKESAEKKEAAEDAVQEAMHEAMREAVGEDDGVHEPGSARESEQPEPALGAPR